MPDNFLHNHPAFPDLIRVLEAETGILPQLIEKDYWIMHVLHGLKSQGFEFQLKGGTSLSKGFKIIDRFSEDIDLHIKPHPDLNVNGNPNNSKAGAVESRKGFYDWLAKEIQILDIVSIHRDSNFDDIPHYRSGGIRLNYKSVLQPLEGLKEGILLEVGFDTVTPNTPLTISSWAFEKATATKGIVILDNRAVGTLCYDPGHTLVEKLQTIATKFRQEQQDGRERQNLMRQYYDVYSLLENPQVQAFIGTREYKQHKANRFPIADLEIPIQENEAFLLSNPELRSKFKERFKRTASLYYKGQPEFETLLDRLHSYLERL